MHHLTKVNLGVHTLISMLIVCDSVCDTVCNTVCNTVCVCVCACVRACVCVNVWMFGGTAIQSSQSAETS